MIVCLNVKGASEGEPTSRAAMMGCGKRLPKDSVI